MKWLSGEIKPAEDSTSNKLQNKGYEHEKNYLQSLKDNAQVIFGISKDQPLEVCTRQTTNALQNAEDLLRNIDFLYSKNRLNVAISRAQYLSVVVVNPNLMEVPPKKMQQMKLGNIFCWLTGMSSN
ncbi:MAG: hypothetical protein H2069_00665 [Legionella sp.]|nr:hypothetical protein [Legionella sp.]